MERNEVSTEFGIGSRLPEFSLLSTNNQIIDSKGFLGKPTVVFFTCNHCPYVKGTELEINRLAIHFSDVVNFIGINSNDATDYPEDSFSKMQEKANIQKINYIYLYDQNQSVAKKFDAACTPEFYLFNSDGFLVYHGTINDSPRDPEKVDNYYLENAINQVLEGNKCIPDFVHPMGCSIKWIKNKGNKMDLKQTKELADTIRILSAEGVQAANSGHPGMPMGAADYASVLWRDFLKFNPKDPNWMGRDRFVLSAGHGSMLVYSLLHLFGYNLPMTELQNFRQWGSKTPGHPEYGWTEGVETTTGPLGAGFSNGVGLALSSKMLGERYGKLFEYRVFGIVSDGDLMEGISYEAASLAGHLKLNNLVYLYDDNHISIGGDTNVCFTEDVVKRFESQGWFVQQVDGHDLIQIKEAIEFAVNEQDRPSIICCRTSIGKGAATQEGNHEIHGSPLGAKELEATKKALGRDVPPFFVSNETKAFCEASVILKQEEYKEWNKQFNDWKNSNSNLASELTKQVSKEITPELKAELISAFTNAGKSATRVLSGKVLQVLAKHLPGLVGGSADLEPSTKTLINGSSDVQPNAYAGRNLRFGIREHAMGGIVNGLAYTNYWFPYTATFLVFADYMRPTIRLAALSHIQSLFIFTHDSFHVGEDGPTHQPVEHIATLRAIPNLLVFRPADGLETAMSYFAAISNKKRPSTLLFTRQDLEPIARSESFNPDDITKGAYVAYGQDVSDLVCVATGSEVSLAIDAAKLLEASNIKVRVVSMPCMELFLEQSDEYKNSVIPTKARKIALEAGLMFGWDRVVGDGLKIGKSDYGASAPAKVLAEKFGFTPSQVADKIKSWV